MIACTTKTTTTTTRWREKKNGGSNSSSSNYMLLDKSPYSNSFSPEYGAVSCEVSGWWGVLMMVDGIIVKNELKICLLSDMCIVCRRDRIIVYPSKWKMKRKTPFRASLDIYGGSLLVVCRAFRTLGFGVVFVFFLLLLVFVFSLWYRVWWVRCGSWWNLGESAHQDGYYVSACDGEDATTTSSLIICSKRRHICFFIVPLRCLLPCCCSCELNLFRL